MHTDRIFIFLVDILGMASFLYGAYLLVRNILLLKKGVRSVANIYFFRTGFLDGKQYGPYIKFFAGDKVIDKQFKSFSEAQDDVETGSVNILYHPKYPYQFVVCSPKYLYV